MKSTSLKDARGLLHSLELGTAIILALAVVAALAGCAGAHFPPAAAASASQPAQPVAATAPPPSVVFLGDSITFLWGEPSFSPAFALHPAWTDAGEIGDDSGQIADRFAAQVVAAVPRPRAVAILAGTNDVYPWWELCGGEHNWDTCQQLQYMVGQAQANGVVPILATIPPWGCADAHCALAAKADSSPERYARIDQLNAWIQAYGAAHGLVVVDYHSALVAADEETYAPADTIDGVHPSAAGYALMTPLVEAAIAEATR